MKFSEAELIDYVNSVIKKDKEAETLSLLVGHIDGHDAKVLHLVPIQEPCPDDKCPKGSLAIDEDLIRSIIDDHEGYQVLGIMHHHCYKTEERPAEVTKNVIDKEKYPRVCMPGWGDIYTEIYENAIGVAHAKLARVIIGTSQDKWHAGMMPIHLFAYHIKEDCKQKETAKLIAKMKHTNEFREFTQQFTKLEFLREETEKLYSKGLQDKLRVIETKPRYYHTEIR